MFNPVKFALGKIAPASLFERKEDIQFDGVIPNPTGGKPLMSFSLHKVTSDDGEAVSIRLGVTAPALVMQGISADVAPKPEEGRKKLRHFLTRRVKKATELVKRKGASLAVQGTYTTLLQMELFAHAEAAKSYGKTKTELAELEPATKRKRKVPVVAKPKVAFFYSED